MVRIRLTRKFANFIDGIDLSRRKAGDLLDLSEREAKVLLAEGWASTDDVPPTKSNARKPRKPLSDRK